MTMLTSLPYRPLTLADVTALHGSDRLEMPVPVTWGTTRADDGTVVTISDQRSLATDGWLAGPVYDDGGTAVEHVEIEGARSGRFSALQACRDAIEAHVDSP